MDADPQGSLSRLLEEAGLSMEEPSCHEIHPGSIDPTGVVFDASFLGAVLVDDLYPDLFEDSVVV